MLKFIEKEHQYFWDENGASREIPGTTRIIGEWRYIEALAVYYNIFTGTVIDKYTLENAGEFGKAVHKACKLILLERLDWNHLVENNSPLIPCLEQFKQFLYEYKYKAIHVEEPIMSKRLWVAGTPDSVGEMPMFKGLSMPDIKTGNEAIMVGPQTASYEVQYKEYFKYKGMMYRFVLHLPKDGSKFKLKALKSPSDIIFFKLRLSQHNILKRREL